MAPPVALPVVPPVVPPVALPAAPLPTMSSGHDLLSKMLDTARIKAETDLVEAKTRAAQQQQQARLVDENRVLRMAAAERAKEGLQYAAAAAEAEAAIVPPQDPAANAANALMQFAQGG
jgi:hypothetical protein